MAASVRRPALLALLALTTLAGLRPPAPLGATTVPNDPLYKSDQAYLAFIHAPEAWDVQTGDARVIVAVIDDGIDTTHPDLARNIWTNPQAGSGDCGEDVHGCNFLDPTMVPAACSVGPAARTPDISPTGPTGTYLAGVIGAAGNNGQGITGVVWNVALMAVRVADCRGGADTPAVVQGIHYAVDHGARVIDAGVLSNRFSGGACRPPNPFLADAVQYARDHGAVVIAGAGDNNRGCVADPAAAPGALAVGGFRLPEGDRWRTSRTGRASNWGSEVAVAAPASRIIGTVPRRAGQQPPNDLYAAGSGTAAAAALVSGEAALLLSQNPQLTPDWLIQLIELGARPLAAGPTPGWAGAGAIDLAASLRLVPAAYSGALMLGGEPAMDGTLVEGYVGATLCGQAASFSAGGVASYTLYVPAAAMWSGCGVAGRSVEIRVEGVTAAVVPWGATAYPLDLDAVPGRTDLP